MFAMAVVVVAVMRLTFAERRKLLNSRFHKIYLTLSHTKAASNNGR